MKRALIEKVVSVKHHRNGISGDSFFRVDLEHESKRLIAVVADSFVEDRPNCEIPVFVIDPSDPVSRWRGDNFAEELAAVIESVKDSRETYSYASAAERAS